MMLVTYQTVARMDIPTRNCNLMDPLANPGVFILSLDRRSKEPEDLRLLFVIKHSAGGFVVF